MTMTSRTGALLAVLAGTLAATTPAHALDFMFTIKGDPTLAGTNLYNSPWVSGDVTGILHGLKDNASAQLPTSVELTSGYQSFGITQTLYTPADWYLGGAGSFGLTVANGDIVSGGLKITLSEGATYKGTMLAINQGIGGSTPVYNALIWYFGAGPIQGKGNELGSAGVAFNEISAVPEADGSAMLVGGLGVLGWLVRRRRVH